GIDAAGGNEAFLLRLQEASLPLGAVGFTLDLGEGSGDAAPDLRDALLAVLGVLLEQGIPADFLLSGRGGEMKFHGTERLYSGARGARAPGETGGLAEKLVAGGGDRRRGFAVRQPGGRGAPRHFQPVGDLGVAEAQRELHRG